MSPGTAGCWSAAARAACWCLIRPPAPSRRWSVEVDGRPLQFCSNVTELADGTIYFTESTSAFTYEHFLGPIFEARNRGSVFRREPDGTVLTVVAGLYFANGITPTADGSALVFAETSGAAAVEVLAHGRQGGHGDSAGGQSARQPGQPLDRCRRPDLVRDGVADQCGGGVAAKTPPALRKLLWRLPDRLQPKIKPIVWAVAFDPDTGNAVAGVRTEHPQFGMVTGLVEADGKLWMGVSARRPSRTSTWGERRATALPVESQLKLQSHQSQRASWETRPQTPNLRSPWRTYEPRPSALRPW